MTGLTPHRLQPLAQTYRLVLPGPLTEARANLAIGTFRCYDASHDAVPGTGITALETAQ